MHLLLACALLLQETPETAFKKIEAAQVFVVGKLRRSILMVHPGR